MRVRVRVRVRVRRRMLGLGLGLAHPPAALRRTEAQRYEPRVRVRA